MSTVRHSANDDNPLHYLLGSEYRIVVLETLASGPNDPITIARTYDIPRSSLHRTVQELESKGWIERNGSALKLKPLGQYVLTLYSHIETEIQVITVATQISPWITLDVGHISVLRDGEVNLRDDQPKPLDVFFAWVEENNRFDAYFPTVPTLFDRFLTFTSGATLTDATIHLSRDHSSQTEYVDLERTFEGEVTWTGIDSDFGILFEAPNVLLFGTDHAGVIQTTVRLNGGLATQFGAEQFREIRAGSSE